MRPTKKQLTLFGVITWLMAVFVFVCQIFWENELVYNLPTPVPKNHTEIPQGTLLQLNDRMTVAGGKPMLIHFFNPKCPCSRFNMTHFKTLVRKYGSQMDFAVVVLSQDGSTTQEQIKDRFNIDLPIYFDEEIAKRCGVIATPQAVIIDNSKLFYRGNYNKSRYCTDTKSNYAQMAIDSLLVKRTMVTFNPLAFTAYGCSLPSSKTCKYINP